MPVVRGEVGVVRKSPAVYEEDINLIVAQVQQLSWSLDNIF